MNNLVIKVGVASGPLGTVDNPVFCRLSYEDVKETPLQVLGKHALKLSGEPKDACLRDYKINFVYTDEDGDTILVDSKAVLQKAFHEAQGTLKIMAIVKKIDEIPSNDVQNNKQLFIHGRHECTNCSKKPIIGKRFHDGTDMNLCETCHGQYCTGDDAKLLKKVELDCDRVRQKQWRRQYRTEYREAVSAKRAQRQAIRRLKKLKQKPSQKESKLDEPPILVEKVVVGEKAMDWQDIKN